MNKYVVIALTEDYHKKSEALYNSLEKNRGGYKVRILAVGFEVRNKRESFEYATCNIKDLPSYREGFPRNRPFYVCLEGGEFLNYFDWNEDDVIIHIDSDMILQRPLSDEEDKEIELLCRRGLIGASSATGSYMSLREEFWRLLPKTGLDNAKYTFNADVWNKQMYCAGMIICSVKTYRELSSFYLGSIDAMIYVFDHHAAGQWLFNYYIHANNKLNHLSSVYHCANWFIDMPYVIRGNQLYFNGEKVLFNHTKYLHEYDY